MKEYYDMAKTRIEIYRVRGYKCKIERTYPIRAGR